MPPTPDATTPGAAAPDRGRADACPGALRLHTADDGALARVRLPGGLLTVRQALALADAAEVLGDGSLETTSRGNVQLRGLAPGCGGELGDRLRAAGLLPSDTHERVRNIVASPGPAGGRPTRGRTANGAPVEGRSADGRPADGRPAGDGPGADVRAWARELDARLCASPWATGLSGKFLFVLDDGRGDVAALDADVTLIAGGGGTALLRLGRAATARVVPADGAVDAALDAARSFLEALRATGTRAWHLREVPGLLPPGDAPLPDLPGEPVPLGALPGGLSVGLRFGRATAAQWRVLAGAAEGELRLTPWRGAVLPDAPADRLPVLAAAGYRTEPGSPWDRATACTGLPGCAKSLADVRADAARALDADADAAAVAPGAVPVERLPVHWSGCERRCGHPAGRWVDVLATGRGYRVTTNGPENGPTNEPRNGSTNVPKNGPTNGSASAGPAVGVTNEETAAAVAAARRTTK
ncbi:cobalamin biosynthesis protein CobG [Kitasatospora sp. NBC_00458]